MMDNMDIGNFKIIPPWEYEMEFDNNDEELATIDIESLAAIGSVQDSRKMKQELEKIPEDEKEEGTTTNKPRFKTITKDKQKQYESMNQSEATKKNTKWGLKILQDWHNEKFKKAINMAEIKTAELAVKLQQFYCEVKPQEICDDDNGTTGGEQTRPSKKMKIDNSEYKRTSLISIRAAINRHLHNIGREIDIVSDKEFKKANDTLNGILKERVAMGKSQPVKHKDVLKQDDLRKISTYLEQAKSNPISLRLCVWYLIAFHFLTRGLEFHVQLNQNSFEFKTDENHQEYACLNHETKAKNYQGGVQAEEAFVDKRMYATGTSSCPVDILKFFLSKSDPSASGLFNHINPDAISNPKFNTLWYNTKPLKKCSFSNFLPDLCKKAGCIKRYTAHCLRATAIQAMNDAGVETRHIMYMSGHRNEASVRSYTRECSSLQKKSFSDILSSKASGSNSLVHVARPAMPSATSFVPPYNPITAGSVNNPQNQIVPFDITNTMSSQSGFLTNSTFNGCSVNINVHCKNTDI